MSLAELPQWSSDVSIAQLATTLAFVGALWASLRKVLPVLRRVGHVIDDLAGEAERPGVAHRPGIIERVASVDARLDNVAARLEVVEHATRQLLRNGGDHLADSVHRIEQTQRENSARDGQDVADIPGEPPASVV